MLVSVRPNGQRLKTFGGRASGPQPLVNLFDFVIEKFKGAKGRKLNLWSVTILRVRQVKLWL